MLAHSVHTMPLSIRAACWHADLEGEILQALAQVAVGGVSASPSGTGKAGRGKEAFAGTACASPPFSGISAGRWRVSQQAAGLWSRDA